MGIGRGRPGRAKAVRAASRHQATGGAAGKVPPTGGRVTPVTAPRPSRRSTGAKTAHAARGREGRVPRTPAPRRQERPGGQFPRPPSPETGAFAAAVARVAQISVNVPAISVRARVTARVPKDTVPAEGGEPRVGARKTAGAHGPRPGDATVRTAAGEPLVAQAVGRAGKVVHLMVRQTVRVPRVKAVTPAAARGLAAAGSANLQGAVQMPRPRVGCDGSAITTRPA